MKLFLLERVEAAEKTDAFVTISEKAKRRSEAMKASAAKRREKNLDKVRHLNVKVDQIDMVNLRRLAIRCYNQIQQEKPFEYGRIYNPATEDSDPEFLKRIMVNYLRHQRTRYDELLRKQYGIIGVDYAKDIVRAKAYAAIITQYPELADECHRQLAWRGCSLALAA